VKTIINLGLALALFSMLAACADSRRPHRHKDHHGGMTSQEFDHATQRTYNPQTRNFDMQPPIGPQADNPPN